MDKDTRNAIERATQRARKVLEEDFGIQLEGDFDVHRDGTLAARAGGHLSVRQAFQRERIVAAIEHKRAAGMGAEASVADYLRDAAFTTLNRFVALKMLEARELVQECITKGEQSAGYLEFSGMAPGLPLLPNSAGYRIYIESLFDELSTEVKVLFDRRDPSSVLWPKRATFEQLLEILNTSELAGVWGEDETIGWVYQFFNGQDERRKMREESQAPRNSRELAVRNQFFTPRYVVQFLTDNTLGRIWYEMRGAKTVLADQCEYMIRKPCEVFAPRAKKDPRDLRVLDPACGSGHFLLYAFDLLLAIYEEAHADPESPQSESTRRTLAEDYLSVEELRKAVPGLILAHNLHGVDIDPRCAQIAQLALWMRAQRAHRDFGVGRAERAQIRRSNIVVAEPLVSDEQIAREFVADLGDAELARVFTELSNALQTCGETGILLRAEKLIVRQARRGETANLFAPPAERIRKTLAQFLSQTNRQSTRKRLFADDASHGLGMLETVQEKYDVILMNPPFGDPPKGAKEYIFSHYGSAKTELYAAFIDRAVELAPDGLVGCLSSRSGYFLTSLERWRQDTLLAEGSGAIVFLDLGEGVLDAAVECACVVIGKSTDAVLCAEASGEDREQKLARLRMGHGHADLPEGWKSLRRATLSKLPGSTFAYRLPEELVGLYETHPSLAERKFVAKQGIGTSDNFRFLRLRWEVAPESDTWLLYSKGGGYSPYFVDSDLVVNWLDEGKEIKAYSAKLYGTWSKQITNTQYFGKPGLTYSSRTHREFAPALQPMPSGFDTKGCCIFSHEIVADDVWFALLAVTNSRLFAGLLRVGLARASSGLARQYNESLVAAMPIPDLNQASDLALRARASHRVHEAIEASIETASFFDATPWFRVLHCDDGASALRALHHAICETWGQQVQCARAVNAAVEAAYFKDRLPDGVSAFLNSDVGFEPTTPSDVKQPDFWNPLRESPFAGTGQADLEYRETARAALSVAFGALAGRWGKTSSAEEGKASIATRSACTGDGILCVDDDGSALDLAARLAGAGFTVELLDQLAGIASEGIVTTYRAYVRSEFMSAHAQMYSSSKRRAPVYWQLATPSASYSVWLYIHAFSKDSLFRVQNDYAVPKLAHEERRLESLASELSDRATAVQRKTLAAQESFVEELRAFLEEVKRVAPLWNPNLDDGVVINFAPLWRLVPQNRSWQKELKSTWEALCEGKYDWAHLAFHLWPERVIPKCAKDRSLAVAHGLEDVFWAEGTDGKWTARKTPTRSVEELIRESTSPAVKSALKNLLEAPAATGNAGRGRGGRRKIAVEGGNA
ncbi:BREX-1 system adenine-specific DNA-methyltransferase PglX [Burkholderia sp. Bp8986]|uniref:BREX-1 system adenine-specific DNA-methyltransferase PglX n=1 Tax=Burkholderia sp. Bp8986 TaxID=2184550 RepID=UPI000F5B26D3|nr:BREX-1 system adenine-specific DNA-methyltransferase PglX [Burkholderia sp. Bp8986]RQS53465.1 BREX-1 system adenine-specific DNA-methyltransferase PglX [Burkholderia sp. Bp8986]